MTNWGCRRDPAEEDVSCTSFVTLVCGCRALEGRAAQLLGSRESVCESDLRGQDGQPERVHPTFVFAGRHGFRTKATEAAEELCLVLVTLLYNLPLSHGLR